jgi:hypothetical protein
MTVDHSAGGVSVGVSRIPSGPEDVDAEWLTAALAPRFPGVRVAAVEVAEVRQVTNCHSFLDIRYDEQAGAPDHVFGKMAPLRPDRREVVLQSRMGTKEVDFYTRLATRLPGIRKPDVYVAAKDDDDLTFVMLMEDLVRNGCRIPDGTWGITADQAAVALEELADLHVRFEDPARRQAEVPWAPLARDGKPPGQGLLRYGLDHHRDKLSDLFAWATETYLAHPEECIALWANGPGPHTVNHGDPHIGNLFDDHGRVGFLDWGVINVTTPIRDAGYILTMAMQPEDRRAHERELMRHYLDARKLKGGAEIGFDEAWMTHRLHALYTVPAACQIVTFPEDAPPRRQVFAAAFLARVEAALEDLEVRDAIRTATGWT